MVNWRHAFPRDWGAGLQREKGKATNFICRPLPRQQVSYWLSLFRSQSQSRCLSILMSMFIYVLCGCCCSWYNCLSLSVCWYYITFIFPYSLHCDLIYLVLEISTHLLTWGYIIYPTLHWWLLAIALHKSNLASVAGSESWIYGLNPLLTLQF